MKRIYKCVMVSLLAVSFALTAEIAETADKGHENATHVELTAKGRELADIQLSKVFQGSIFKTIEFSGNIAINEEKQNSIVPRYAGIARSIKKRIGEKVSEGEIVAEIENKETFTKFSVTSPISGEVIARNANKGEFLSEEEAMFTVADLSEVWVDIDIYPKDAKLIKKGVKVAVSEIGVKHTGNAEIFYISPVADPESGTFTARALLANEDRSWKPGSFVKCSYLYKAAADVNLVKSTSLQLIGGQQHLFIEEGSNIFEPIAVKTGVSNNLYTEIKSGLDTGNEYVSNGAFELKSQISIGDLGEHAGCGGSH